MYRNGIFVPGHDLMRCPECQKKFIPAPKHIYRSTSSGTLKYYCSYTCYRNAGYDSPKAGPRANYVKNGAFQ